MTIERGIRSRQTYLGVVPVTSKVTIWDVLAVIVRLLVEPRASGIGQTRIPTGHEQVLPLTVNPRVLELLGIS